MAATLTEHDSRLAAIQGQLEERARTIIELNREREELLRGVAADFADRPEGAMHALLDEPAVRAMSERANAAYASRDRAMAAYWRMDDLHHAVAGDRCSCGKAARSCPELGSIGFFRETYYAWERRQIEAMKAGRHHGLPRDHPSARAKADDWSWRGAPTTQRDSRARYPRA